MVTVCFCIDYGKKYTFTGGWEEKWGLKLTSAKVEVEAELGNNCFCKVTSTKSTFHVGNWVPTLFP